VPHPLRLLAAASAVGLAWLLHATAMEPQPVPPDHAAKMAKSADLFKSQVGPLLKSNCLRCHGGKKTEGGLDISNRDRLLKGGEHGAAVVPGDAKKSRLYQLAAHLKDPHMPDGGEKLPAADLARLAEWIDLGAAYDAPLAGPDPKAAPIGATGHWAFQLVKKPAIPKLSTQYSVLASPIDHFILAKLEAKSLKSAPPADKRTLVRRVTFDLTGLPPTPEEVEAFIKHESPDAYEKLIDRLLASPAYGERWGRHWLDLVRYCDSFDARGVGGAEDCADAWRFRDWVVKSLNADMPYDKFVRMQIAGDVLPLPDAERADGITATGMLAIGNWGGGDSDKEKLLTDIADDQIDVVGRTVMGLTIACARCHDHKFDPLTQKDYYALAGIFFSTHILPSVGPKTNGPPMLRIPLEKPPEEKGPVRTVLAKRAKDVAGKPGLFAWRNNADCPNCVANATGAEARFGTIIMPAKTVALHPGPQTDVAAVWTSPVAGEVRIVGKLTDFDPNCGDGIAWELRHVPAKGEAKKLAAGTVANGKAEEFDKAKALKATVAAGDRLELVVNRNTEYTCDTTGVAFIITGEQDAWDFAADWLAKLPDGAAKTGVWSVEEFGGAKPYTGPLANGAQEGGVPGSPHAGVHDVKVHIRGRYDRLGDLVPRGFPEVVKVADTPKIASGSGRKELADWLTRPDHPLTARVIVNRVWQYHFGRGIVNTPSNFGLLGEKPTHPELLDYLAATFIEDGWSLKKLHKRVLLSATYRQSADGDPTTRAKDPDNTLFGRYPRRRLEAEAIRDSLLVAAGKLDATRGGPATRDFNSPRRTLYLMTIRSDRTGFGPLFDAADSTAPVDVRTVSTVAPQALFLLNHPFAKAQTAAFADRVMKAKADTADRLDLAHRIAFGRPPTADEVKLGAEFVAAGNGTRDAWAAWCHLLIESNEFVMIE
jgi:Protein of unknown function (DUF1553)/Protein of unknown function (DUF1549)/Planctomycete cytochrome C